jgi:hypothetical protein
MIVIVGAVLMAIDSVAGSDVAPALSLTVTEKVKGLPAAERGVPLITPLMPSRFSPGGSEPDDTLQFA